MWPFFQFPVWVRSFRLTAWLLIVVSHRIVRGFDRYGSTQAVALDISKALDKSLARWSSSQVLWSFGSDIWAYLFFPQ